MPSVKVDSFKQKIGKDFTYPLATSDVVAALEPKLSADVYLAIYFSPQQAYRMGDRDAVDARGLYRVASLTYAPIRQTLRFEQSKPWAHEQSPQVVDARVTALPRRVLPAGTGLRRHAAAILGHAVAAVARSGLPAGDRARRSAWIVDVEYDAPGRILRALLRPWNGGEHAVSQQFESSLGAKIDHDD